MAVTVPSTDVGNFYLQAQVTLLSSNLTAAQTAGNYALAAVIAQQLDVTQQALVASLMANGNNRLPGVGNSAGPKPSFLTASGILSAGTINT